MAAFDASLLSSPGAQALSELVTSLASEWTARANTRDEVALAFGTVHRVIVTALPQVATAWNMKHDVFSSLPSELQEQCLSPLSVVEKRRLSLVCSHWRSEIACLPGIWTHLDISGWRRGLAELLARSGRLALDLDVSMDWDMTKVDNCLRAHAHRIRSLKLTSDIFGSGDAVVLRYPLPLLEELSIENHLNYASTLSISEEYTPHLRTLSLFWADLPPRGIVFSRVTTLNIVRSSGGLQHLYHTFPVLKHLRIEECLLIGLPKVPFGAPLQTLEILDSFIGTDSLVVKGYTRLDRLTWRTNEIVRVIAALILVPENPSALQERDDYETSLTLHRGGHRSLRFIICPGGRSVLQHLLCEHRAIFGRLSRLALPASYRLGAHDEPQTTLAAGAVADLPALRTLAIECNTRRPSVLLFDCVHGTIRAPALARVELITVADALDIEHVDAGRLAAFICDALVCDDRGGLELFVDTERGAQLEGDLDTLRASVGNLLV